MLVRSILDIRVLDELWRGVWEGRGVALQREVCVAFKCIDIGGFLLYRVSLNRGGVFGD